MGNILEVGFWNVARNKNSAGKAIERYYKYCSKRKGEVIAGFAKMKVFENWSERLYYCITEGYSLVAVEVFPEDESQIDFKHRYDLVGTKNGKLLLEKSELHVPDFAAVAVTGIEEPIPHSYLRKDYAYSKRLSSIIGQCALKYEGKFSLDYVLLDKVVSCLHGLNNGMSLAIHLRDSHEKPAIISAGESAFGLIMPFEV